MAHWVCPACWAEYAPNDEAPPWLEAAVDMTAAEEMRARTFGRREVSLEALLDRARKAQEAV